MEIERRDLSAHSFSALQRAAGGAETTVRWRFVVVPCLHVLDNFSH